MQAPSSFVKKPPSSSGVSKATSDITHVKEEAFVSNALRSVPCEGKLHVKRIEVDLSNWLSFLNAYNASEKERGRRLKALVDAVASYDEIGITLKRVTPASVSTPLCDVFESFLAPRIVSLSMVDSQSINMSLLAALVPAKGAKMRKLQFVSCEWVTDTVIEQLSIRCHATLEELHLEKLNDISNKSMYELGRRCSGLIALELVCCPGISDSGLCELVKKNNFCRINVSHSMLVTDQGVEALISNCRALTSLTLVNVPQLSDRAIKALYEAVFSWGSRRNGETAAVTEIVLNDNSNFTAQMLVLLSIGMQQLKTLDLRDCAGVALVRALSEVKKMSSIRHLRLGPITNKKHKLGSSDLFLQGILHQAPRLLTLHLDGIAGFTDAHMAAMLEEAEKLEALCLRNLDFGTLTTEALCSCLPGIETLELVGSRVFADIDLRCIASVCKHMRNLTLQHCERLSDVGFTRFTNTPHLRNLDLGYCSQGLTGEFLNYFTTCTLQSLVLDGLRVQPATSFPKLLDSCTLALERVSLRDSVALQPVDLLYVLHRFVRLASLDLAGCNLSAEKLKKLEHWNPYLTFLESRGGSFVGFGLSDTDQAVYTQFWATDAQYRKHYAAKLLQRLRRLFLEDIFERKVHRREKWEDFKLRMLVKVQARFRLVIARRMVRAKLAAGWRITFTAQSYLIYKFYKRSHPAKAHYRRHLKRMLFGMFCELLRIKKVEYTAVRLAVARNWRRFMLKKYMKILKRARKEFAENHFEEQAVVMWEMHFLQRVLEHWKTMITNPRNRMVLHRQRLVALFLTCVAAEASNSFRQKADRGMADHYRRRQLMLPAWLMLSRNILEIRRIAKMAPYIAEYAKRMFWWRMMGGTYRELVAYEKTRKFKKAAKAKGDAGFVAFNKMLACRHVWERMLYIQRARAMMQRASSVQMTAAIKTQREVAYRTRVGLRDRFPERTRVNMYLKMQRDKAKRQFNSWIYDLGFGHCMDGCIWSKRWRELNKKAEMHRNRKYRKIIFRALNDYKMYKKNIGKLYYRRYLLKLCRKVLHGLQVNAKYQQDALRELIYKMETRAKKQGVDPARVIASLVKFQGIVRGVAERQRWNDVRVSKLYSIQTIQNFMRVYLAKKERRRRYRMKHLTLFLNEERETDLMRDEELATIFFNYQLHNIVNIQRVFRGMRGRRLGEILASENFRWKAINFVDQQAETRERHEKFKAAELARKNRKISGATLIQKRVRGMLARIRFVEIKRQGKMNKYAVYVQQAYRKRMGMARLRALRRDKNSELRFLAARRQRGWLMRRCGFKNRSGQALFSRVLDVLGLDPLSYNYRVGELLGETLNDFWAMVTIFKREKDLVKEHGKRDLFQMRKDIQIGRERAIGSLGWKLQVNDAVRIIDPAHQFLGHTGLICRIDDTILGTPLFEIKLDRVNAITFVRMTTDPWLNYDVTQPIVKIKSIPTLGAAFKQPWCIFGLELGNDFYCKKNVYAAWVIQRAFRQHRARKIVSRIRYELWASSISQQWSMVQHLQETNSITAQSFNIFKYLGLTPKRPVFSDEVRHRLNPERFTAKSMILNEKTTIKREFDAKFKDRMRYMQKCAVSKGRDFFDIGVDRLTFGLKVRLAWSLSCGKMAKIKRKRLARLKDQMGVRGAKNLRDSVSMVEGINHYCFEQFRGSPHVRYHKLSLYQGEWSGVPLFSPLKPSGDGIICFLDGWGFAREDKVLYVKIYRCKHLNPSDLSTGLSDPFCQIMCNNITLETSVKWANLHPEFHESFEIDVTNPMAKLNIVVNDKDFVGSDDFLGQVELKLADYDDGKEHVFDGMLLRGEDVTVDEGFDRGEITFSIRWAERIFEDDQLRLEAKARKVLVVQAWARRLAAQALLRTLSKEKAANVKIVLAKALKITNTCRIRIARKKLRVKKRYKDCVIRIQKRIRIYIAKKIFRYRRSRHRASVRIQTVIRIVLAKARVVRIIEARAAEIDAQVTVIQKYARRMLAKGEVHRMRVEFYGEEAMEKERLEKEEAERLAGEEGSVGSLDASVVPVSKFEPIDAWIKTYGVDPQYGLKRNRRISDRGFAQLLKTRHIRVPTKYGTCYIDSYPPQKSDEELSAEQAGMPMESLTAREDFVQLFLPPFTPDKVRRFKAMELNLKHQHLLILHIPTCLDAQTVMFFTVRIIQCAVRQRIARARMTQMKRVHRAFSVLQRRFRKRYEVQEQAARIITALMLRKQASVRVGAVRLEHRSTMVLEMSYRSYRARSKLFDLRCVENLSVLKHSSSVPLHGPEKCLEHRSDTFWISDSPEFAEIRVEFAKVENVTHVWIMTSTYDSSPRYVTIQAVPLNSGSYKELVPRYELPYLKEHRWHCFKVPVFSTKYFKVLFQGNNGNEEHLAVRQIRFVRSKEMSACIETQPQHYLLEDGPNVGAPMPIVLRVEASGWPLPSYQWFKAGKKLEGETSPELKLELMCPMKGSRFFRCIRCKMVAKEVAQNAYRVRCGNCGYTFSYKEADEFEQFVIDAKEREDEIQSERRALIKSKEQMENFKNSKYDGVLAELRVSITLLDEKLQALRESRIAAKKDIHIVNRFSDEGIYVCEVSNLRGRGRSGLGAGVKIMRRTIPTVVVVERSKPFVVAVHPFYFPRPVVIRKKWNMYSSLRGKFRNGVLEGLVLVRYSDGSFYEGPYVQESALDLLGIPHADARAYNHFGIFKLPDGRTFSGARVDNHFDPNNLQGFYRVNFDSGERYEGNFCDDFFHGIGMYSYKDGSVYEGNWHKGKSFGHGHLRSAEGWTYEGFFDTGRRHRDGVITWSDGSCYMGEWFYDKIKGHGVYVSPLRDVYKGHMSDGMFNGGGEMLYADTSRYVGFWKDGKRHGRGIATDRDGTEHYGHFENDKQHGEHVVKIIIKVEEAGQNNYEVRVGVFEHGKFIKWKTSFPNPIATRQFVQLFRDNRDMFDSVYSMILAKNLPGLPDGIDPDDALVKNIMLKIRNEAGHLVGEQALRLAQQQMEALLQPIQDKTAETVTLSQETERISLQIIELQKEVSWLHDRFTNLLFLFEKETLKIEQFWTDEPKQVRAKFDQACENLKQCTIEEFFSYRNYRVVPAFTKKVFDGLALSLNMSTDWETQQFLVADSISNARHGDDEAKRLSYSCKLVHMMQDYKVYDFIENPHMHDLYVVLSDNRFRGDSYYVHSTGRPGPFLVDWIRSNYNYVMKAREVKDVLESASVKKTEGFRYKAQHAAKIKEMKELEVQLDSTKATLEKSNTELHDLEHLLLKANDLLQFVMGRAAMGSKDVRVDYYKEMERKLEANKTRFSVEVCLKGICEGAVEKLEAEEKKKLRDCLALGNPYVAPYYMLERPPVSSLRGWLLAEVREQQEEILSSGRTLGYSFEPEENPVTTAYTQGLINLVADLVLGKINDAFNDMASATEWWHRGKKFTVRFLYIMAWKIWEDEALRMRDEHAIAKWNEIFGDTPDRGDICARMSVEAKVSARMARVAREQAKVWAKAHPMEVAMAEAELAQEFEEEFPEDTPTAALDLMDDESTVPALKAKCASWIRLHPDEMQRVRDVRQQFYADSFAKQFPDGEPSTAAQCFKIINGWAQQSDMDWVEYADHWRSLNTELYTAAGEAMLLEMGTDFVEAYPLETYLQAARVVEQDSISKWILDEAAYEEVAQKEKDVLNANAWAVKHQGLYRKGKKMIAAQYSAAEAKLWLNVTNETDKWRKGSAALVVMGEADRFKGFRDRLAAKYAWLHGYLCKQQAAYWTDLERLELEDPLGQIVHRVRPSQLERHVKTVDAAFVDRQRKLSEAYADITARLATWNGYFNTEEKAQIE